MTQDRKFQRALNDVKKLLEKKENRQKFAKDLFEISQTIAEHRQNDLVFDASMQEAQIAWNTESSNHASE